MRSLNHGALEKSRSSARKTAVTAGGGPITGEESAYNGEMTPGKI
jgi:hypothetical protein